MLNFSSVAPVLPVAPNSFGSSKSAPVLRPLLPSRRVVTSLSQPKPSATPSESRITVRRRPTSPSATGRSALNTPSLPFSLGILNLTTVLWGTQHAVIKLALEDTNPSTLNFSRFFLAALISFPALRTLRNFRAPVIRHGIELSLYLFAGYALQSAALLTTSASRSAFLLYLNVKLVPLLARVVYGRKISPLTWASAGTALFGTALLTYDGSPPAIGDAFSIAAAAASAFFILRTEAAGREPSVKPAELNAVTLTSVAGLTGIWTSIHAISTILHQGAGDLDWLSFMSEFVPTTPQAGMAVLYLGIVTTALCNFLQAVGQKGMSAERAAVVFAMDPVYGALFAWLLLGESLGVQGFCGAFCILAAAFLSGAADSGKKNDGAGKSREAQSKENDVPVVERKRFLSNDVSCVEEDSLTP